MEYTTVAELVEVLRVEREVVAQLFQPAKRGQSPLRFPYDSVNERLAELSHGFPKCKPPTIQDLLAGRLRLLRRHEVLMLSSYSKSTLPGSGLPHIRLTEKRARYCAASVAAMEARPKAYTLKQTAYIFGVDRGATRELLETKQLHATQSPTDKRALEIARGELATFLEPLLPEWIRPESWIDYRLALMGGMGARLGLQRSHEAQRLLRINNGRLLGLVRTKQLDYIWTPGRKERRFTLDSIMRYLHEGERAPDAAPPPLLFQAPGQ